MSRIENFDILWDRDSLDVIVIVWREGLLQNRYNNPTQSSLKRVMKIILRETHANLDRH